MDLPDHYGVMINPTRHPIRAGIREGRLFGLDNGCFGGEFDPARFFDVLSLLEPYRDQCLFVVCPDKVGDARRTLDLWEQWSARLQAAGWPVAFVAQDGQEDWDLPDGIDWLFIGGSTSWKMGPGARACIQAARERDIPVHVGRVNSKKRMAYFKSLGCTSADGTRAIHDRHGTRRRISQAIMQRHFDWRQ